LFNNRLLTLYLAVTCYTCEVTVNLISERITLRTTLADVSCLAFRIHRWDRKQA